MNRVVLRASEGMVYTNGDMWGKVIYLAVGETADGWYEIPEDEFVFTFESGVPLNEATEEDYQSALREMGVKV